MKITAAPYKEHNVKRLGKIVFIMLFLSMAGSAFSEEAELIPAKTFRITLAPSFGFQVQEWDWKGVSSEKVMLFNTGLGIEYGPASWINLQLLWLPGINVWSKIEGGNYGMLSDLFLGIKAGIFGNGALVSSEKTRFSIALGMKMPLAGLFTKEKADTVREPDQHLWASAFRIYFDYITNSMFFINLYTEVSIYPPQWTVNPAYKTRMAAHYFDMTAELEGHLRYVTENAKLAIKGGIPITLFYAPVFNANDDSEHQLCFSAGLYFGLDFLNAPVELLIKYRAALLGINTEPLHRASLIARFDIGRKK